MRVAGLEAVVAQHLVEVGGGEGEQLQLVVVVVAPRVALTRGVVTFAHQAVGVLLDTPIS